MSIILRCWSGAIRSSRMRLQRIVVLFGRRLQTAPLALILLSSEKNGGALVSTRSLKRRRHVEDGSLASLKSGPKKINADHQDLALAA